MEPQKSASDLCAELCLKEDTKRILREKAWTTRCEPDTDREGCLLFTLKWLAPTGTTVEVEWEPCFIFVEDSLHNYRINYLEKCNPDYDDVILNHLDSTIDELVASRKKEVVHECECF